MKEVLKTLILRSQEAGIPDDLVPREQDLAPFLETRNAVVISGPRRAGKTYMMFQIMKELELPAQEFVYINFEDNVLADFTPRNFEDILTAYKELYPDKKPVLFLDEVHVIPKWELFVRKLVDSRYKVFVTGSNARLLSREYATHLGGRYLELKVFPLSFMEFLRFKNIEVGQHILYSDKRFQVLSSFDEYVNFGGFPEVTLAKTPVLKEKLIDAYFKTAFFRDIVERFKIKDEKLFEIVLKKTAENIGQPFSFRSILNKLRPLGYSVSLKTIINYFEYALTGYLLIPSHLQRESVISREKERKMYFIDNGYLQTFYISQNIGKKLENAVAANLFFSDTPLRYFRNSTEIDFLLEGGIPVQVSYRLSEPVTFEREVKALVNFLEYSGSDVGYIITWNEADTIKRDGKTIKILPAWYFLLFGNGPGDADFFNPSPLDGR